jgi:HEAT repeat protein
MRARSGRTFAALAMLGAAASAVSVAVLQGDRIREEWYLWCLGSRSEGTREVAARRLAELGVLRAIPRLFDLVRGQSGIPVPQRQPGWAFRALQALTTEPLATPFLEPLSRDDDREVRSWALWALSRLGPAGLAVICAALRDGTIECRLDAVNALAKLGADAEPAVSSLVSALRDEDTRVRNRAMSTLGKLGSRAILGPLMALFEAEPGSRPFLAAALLEFYPFPAERDALRGALKDRWPGAVDAVMDGVSRAHMALRRLEEAREP